MVFGEGYNRLHLVTWQHVTLQSDTMCLCKQLRVADDGAEIFGGLLLRLHYLADGRGIVWEMLLDRNLMQLRIIPARQINRGLDGLLCTLRPIIRNEDLMKHRCLVSLSQDSTPQGAAAGSQIH